MAGSDDISDDEFVQAVPPVNLDEPPDEPSGPVGQIGEGLWESAVDFVSGTVQLAVDSAKAAYDIATTEEGKEAAWETAKSMLKDASSIAKDAFSQTPIAPQEWQDDVDRRFDEWVNEKADEFEKDWQDAKDRGEETKFITKKIGWAVIGLITKKLAPRVCVKCAKKRTQKTDTDKDKKPPPPPQPKGRKLGLGLKNSQTDYISWSKQRGYRTYGELSGKGAFSKQIDEAMNAAEEIHFNLKGVDVKKASGKLNEYGEPPTGNYTNYELHLIKTKYRDKVIWHDADGNKMPKDWMPESF